MQCLAVCLSHHFAKVRIIKPLQKLNAGALPTAAAAHKGQRLSRLHRHTQSIQDLDVWPGGVGELTVNEVNVPLEVILKIIAEEGRERGRKTKGWFWILSVLGCPPLSTNGRLNSPVTQVVKICPSILIIFLQELIICIIQ